jgi:predicted AAA+ superfamily ATPase
LAGRAFLNTLHALSPRELAEHFDLSTYCKWGGLPKLYALSTDEEKREFLKTYVYTYIKEEIASEQVVRRLDPFRRFLEVAAQGNGEILNYTNIARDVGSDPKTVQSYYQILEDTLLGFHLSAYHRSIRKQQRQAPKFYFFDLGVKRALENTLALELDPKTYGFGKAFEHFVISECVRLNDYLRKDYRFYYLRTQNQLEIDLIVERPGLPTALVEIKSSTAIDHRDVKTLGLFINDFKPAQGLCLSLDPRAKLIDGIECLPWAKGLEALGFTQV